MYNANMKRKIVLLLMIFLLLFSGINLFASSYYDTGSQSFTISLAADFPLMNAYTKEGKFTPTFGFGESGTHFFPGGMGSLDYEGFFYPYFSMGGSIGYEFNYCTDGKIFTQVPILFKLTYMPISGKIEVPISLGLGFNYLSYNGKSQFTPMIDLTAAFRFYFQEGWGIGIYTGLDFVPELYTDSEKNAISLFIPLGLSVTYRH